MLKLIIFILVLVGFVLFMLDGRRNPKMKEFARFRYAHRGLHSKPEIPENSLHAFSRAVSMGFGAEFDVHLLKDGNLAVIHDSNLNRVCGQSFEIEDLVTDDLKKYHLEGTEQIIPTFKEVLSVFDGKTPLIIELKTKNNAAELCEEVMKQLQGYSGLYCIESFDPSAVIYLKEHYPDVVRGQLSMNFLPVKRIDLKKRILLTFMIANVKSRPDFIAYDVSSRNNIANRICTKVLGIASVSWTIKSLATMETVEKEGSIPIFEQFIPREK